MSRMPRWSVTSVAMALMLAACSGSGAISTTEPLNTVTSTTSPTSTTVAAETSVAPGLTDGQRATLDQLIVAYEAGDLGGIMDLWGSAGDHYRPDIEFDFAMGGRWSAVTCDEGGAGRVRCELLYTNDLLAALGAPELEGFFRLDMSDSGVITDWRYDTGNQATTAAYLAPFSEWVRDNDPDAASDMFTFNGFISPTQRSRELWPEKAEEYISLLG